ncbi:MAG: FAD-dependent oxidoreductase [Planctomycetes bacterium]|nr:FAD-dependent oxidoreductase [Planctomycetota bacterium]
MPNLTIDDRHVEVPEGATVVDAAERLGIEIPTLCFLKGYEPSTSCLVCLVRNRRTGQYIPACATKAENGMELENATDAVRDMRRTALELLLSEHVGDCLAPCFFACPAHMDVPLMLRQITAQHARDAIETIKRDIALPAVLGRVCPKPCESACRRHAADSPVAVCELKRFVADADLASDEPFAPPCRADTGKRVAIVGAGPAGLSAAYYLRQAGHACVLWEKQARAGGRLRHEVTPEELPPDILNAEIEQILKLGIDVRYETAIADETALNQLLEQYDAVLLACGAMTPAQVQSLGLAASRRGIDVHLETYQTKRPGLFAAGTAARGKGMVVRSTADGKEAASTIDQYLSGQVVRGPRRPFSSRIGKVTSEEMSEFLEGAGTACHGTPDAQREYSADEASAQSDRCMGCGCTEHGRCKLERYAILYQADARRFSGQRRPYQVVGRRSNVLFEPGKCIKCELCVKIAAAGGEPLGLTFVGRGFDVELQVPFGRGLDEALTRVAAQCVAACPTAALRFADRPVVRISSGGEGEDGANSR